MAVEEGLVLALDLGTTSNRAILFDHCGGIVASAQREFRQFYPQPGWVEHDPVEIWETSRAVMMEVLGAAAGRPVHCLGLANQRETVVVWDRRTGRPLMPAIVWQDRRTARICADLGGHAPMLRQRTGLPLDPYFSASKMFWIMEHKPEIASAVRGGEAVFGTIDTWALWNLTGGREYATEASNASRTMLFDLHRLSFCDEMMRLFRVPEGALAQVRPSGGLFGCTSADCCGGWEIPIWGILGDQQAALFAHGGWRHGVVKNTYGTGLFLLMAVGTRPVMTEHMLSTVAWVREGAVEYALEGSVFVGGAAIQWLRDGLGLLKNAADSGRMAEELTGNDGVYFVPALTGLGTPHWDPDARGLICGLTRGTGPKHLVRAALESIAFQSCDVIAAMSEIGGYSLERLMVDGGASANDYLMQFQADLLGVPLERPAVVETTALGAAAMAGIASGFWASREEFLENRRVDRVFVPDMDEATRTRLYGEWKQAIRRTLTKPV